MAANIYWVICSQLAYAGSQWFILWLLARFTGPSGVGLFALGLAITAPILMFTGLQLRALQATDMRNHFLPSDYLTMRAVSTSLAMVIFIHIASFTSGTNGAVIALLGVAKCLESLSDGIFGFLHQLERLDLVSGSLLLKAIATAAFGGATIWLTADVVLACAAIAVSFLLTLLFYDIPLYRKYKLQSGDVTPYFRWRPTALRDLLKLGLPLGFVQLLVSLSANTPRYFLDRYRGDAELGVFAAMAYLIVVGQTYVSAAGQAASPSLARLFSAGDVSGFRALLYRILGAAAAFGVAGIVVATSAGRWSLTLLYGERFASGAPALPVIMLAAAVLYVAWLLGFGLTAVREIRSQALLLAGSTLMTLLVSWAFIGRYGVIGAGWAMFAGGAVQAAGAGVLLHFALRRKEWAVQR